jgi:hypothetical protein
MQVHGTADFRIPDPDDQVFRDKIKTCEIYNNGIYR